MPRRFVDLSVPLEAGIASDPPMTLPKIDYRDHQSTAEQMTELLSRPDRRATCRAARAGRWRQLNVSTHNGTHLDAPYHYHSTMNNGERAITIDEVPLDWCFNPGVKLDFRHFDDGYVVTAADVEAELERIGHRSQALRHRRRQHRRPAPRYGQDGLS